MLGAEKPTILIEILSLEVDLPTCEILSEKVLNYSMIILK